MANRAPETVSYGSHPSAYTTEKAEVAMGTTKPSARSAVPQSGMKTSAMAASTAHTTVATARMRSCRRSNESMEARTSRCSLYTRSKTATNSSSVTAALAKSEATCVRSSLAAFAPPEPERLSTASAHSCSMCARLSVGCGAPPPPPPSAEAVPAEPLSSAVALVGADALAAWACALALAAAAAEEAAVCSSSSRCLQKSWNARRAFRRVSPSVLSRPSPIASTRTAYWPPRLKMEPSKRPPSSDTPPVSERAMGARSAARGSTRSAPWSAAPWSGLCGGLCDEGPRLRLSAFKFTLTPPTAPRPAGRLPPRRLLCRRWAMVRASLKRMRTMRSESTACCTRSSKWRERRCESAPESDACSRP
mmetsp:Transcript_13453/g.35033  ORF Transcript_13453/g.35033 Transcript_13453/m.35033 type:complete len:363 (+) Transcript_13453:112-1200(+)